MRTDIPAEVVTAITDPLSYLMYEQITIEPTRMYFTSYTSGSHPPSIADLEGSPDSPALQAVGVSDATQKLITWYNDAGLLKYQVEGSATLTSTGQSIKGRPGCYPSTTRVAWVDTSNNLKMAVADGALLEANNGTPWESGPTDTGFDYTSSELAVHVPFDDDFIAVVYGWNGGLKVDAVKNIAGWSKTSQPGRFMFPLLIETSGSSRTLQDLASYSGAVMDYLTGDFFIYVSNHITGGVEAVQWFQEGNQFSDVFTAFPADLKATICEFRVGNCFYLGDTKYMCGTFIRRENVDDPQYYTMILRSPDGRNWTMDRFSLVSDLPYRNLVAYDAENYIMKLGACNRVSSLPVTWLYDKNVQESTGPSHNRLVIDKRGAISLSDDQVSSLDLDIAAGNEVYMYDAHVEVGAKVTLDLIYHTTSGSMASTYGTYYINSIERGIRDGSRRLRVSCRNLSLWELESMSSPFYTEIISKSSVRDDLDDIETTQLYTAELTGIWEDKFSVDFWDDGKPWDDTGLGITGINPHKKGGIDRTHATGSHARGIRSSDLKDNISCQEYPEFTSTSAVFHIFGWSYAESGSDNDEVRLHLWLEDVNGDLFEHTESGERFENSYPSFAAGDFPIVYTVTMPVGTKIREVGLSFHNSSGTYLYPCRVDCVSGVSTYYGAPDGNTGWYSDKDKEWKIRGKNRPYIMFSRQPYDTVNFMIMAGFEEDVAGYVSGLPPVGYGLVGLAQDGRNYIVGRYEKVNDKLQIVKVRKGVEDVLAEVAPTVSIDGGCSMMFTHKDGHFVLYVRDSLLEWTEQLTYDWDETDSWMFTSQVAAKHTGIYGIITVPSFRITGYDEGGDQDIDKALGVPMLPGYNTLSSFPSSGTVEIGDLWVTYDGIISMTNIRGPFQFRQLGKYDPPFGNGSWGMHLRDHDWNGGPDVDGKLLGSDDGYVYKVRGVKWDVFQTTGGDRDNLPGRAQYYVDEDIILTAYHSMSSRFYITGGLNGAHTTRGQTTYQPWGEYCYLHTTGDIKLNYFWGSSGDIDVTVEDLIDHLSTSAGALARFPGDVATSETTLADTDPDIDVGTLEYTDGFDLRFEYHDLPVGDKFYVKTNATLDEFPDDNEGIRLDFYRLSSNTFLVSLFALPGDSAAKEVFSAVAMLTTNRMRVLLHKQFVTIYANGAWVITFHTKGITYPADTEIYLGHEIDFVSSAVIKDIRLQEMPDWREAIYIDLETDGNAAIQSVIQERPVEIYARWDGSISYWYDPARSTITQSIKPREHTWTEGIPPNGASDAIIYYSEVSTIQDNQYRDAFGFSTKVYRLPNLEAGAVRAAKILLQRAFSERRKHSVAIRPDLRIEPGDKLYVAYTSTGSGTEVEFEMIVDSMKLQHEAVNSTMIIDGREA